ncbi:4-hydroxythreonine-4-phosphate dehydrogenase [Muriicola jejuensis]|uniref:4-hydroxythreonine-4-phosphate dehydrogenase PdxA n=1 Tax=Muriicola jejuensis TaxID=504488 RepID=A0A6P0UFR0_9FLAO|nr:4-hydroxythreonine-4-phosphate dehydrogenase PdxA [Muriicola jejuensis]NER10073.1 4-hydroxythreonine-4-phosphate dehydrogenase PdxA [Muriicola jejuensis]SMP03241.1 4-hydroxythreonine-4-phosphate dehydrogenase [Muriicola jejuensis]
MKKESANIRVGISVGDLNGIGCEVILKTFEDSRMLELCTPIIFASNKTITQQKNDLGMDITFNGVDQAAHAIDGKINVVNVWKETPNIQYGVSTPEAGKYAIRSLKAAVKALKDEEIDLLVTAPINKKNIQSDEFNFPGHTDYLARELGGESLMFMVTDTLKVGLLTDHVAVKDVVSNINRKLIREKIEIIEKSLKMDFAIRRPRIAMLGINPHSGDDGVIGKEDDEVLRPVIREMADKGRLIFGPYAADSFFGSDTYKQFDAILAAYHDQGLIPFKTLSFGMGVNFTAGLSRVRTSPDHGTAYEIAGKGKADAGSFKEAVFKGIEIYRNRMEYEEISRNPLKRQKVKAT